MNPEDYGMLKLHAHNGAALAAAGAVAYMENLRYNYLEGKDTMSFPEATGMRFASESGSGRTRTESNSGLGQGASAGP